MNITKLKEDFTTAFLKDTDNSSRPCSSYKTCDECLLRNFCHFCKYDYKCHTVFSPQGCAAGMEQCHHIEECLRPQPQSVGYGLPFSAGIAVITIASLFICLSYVLSLLYNVYRTYKPRKSQGSYPNIKEPNTVELSYMRPSEEVEKSLLTDRTLDSNEDLVNEFEYANYNEPIKRNYKKRSRRLLRQNIWWKIISGVIFICIIVLGLLFYPRLPRYNICNREVEWESIFQSLRSMSPKLEYQVLGSVINQNRFGFYMEDASVEFTYNSIKIGQWTLNETWKVAPGSITDLLSTIRLEPGFQTGYEMWKDFTLNKLYFHINMNVSGHLSIGSFKIYQLKKSINNIEFLIGGNYDRSLCKCPLYS